MNRVAFIYLHPHTCDDFSSDMPFSLCSGLLRRRGYHSRVLHLYLDREDQQRSRRLEQRLVEHLANERFQVVVFDQVWSHWLLERIKERTGATLVGTDPFAKPSPHMDHVVGGFAKDPLGVVRLVEALAGDGDVAAVPNAWSRQGGELVPGDISQGGRAGPPRPGAGPGEAPFEPDLDHVYINPRFRPPVERKTLTPNTGCPHGLEATDIPALAGLQLPEAVSARGCSFCHQGGDYQGRPGRVSADEVLDQVEVILSLRPQVQEIILRDQSCLRYLPHLMRGAAARQLAPLCFLVSARADHVLRFAEPLQQALQLAEAAGQRLELYLIGFENLSQPMLDLYNKGMTVADCVEAAGLVRDLSRRHPRSLVHGRYKTASFILFTPWVTLDDLQANIDVIVEFQMEDFAAGIPLSKLRLYPNLPLYHKARAEGLLVEAYEDARLDNAAAGGYSAEHPWRFAQARAGLVYSLVARLHPRVPQDREIWLLQQAVDLARGLPDDFGEEEEEAAAAKLEAAVERAGATDRVPRDLIRLEDHEQRSPDTINIATVCNQRCVYCAGYSLAPVSDDEILARLRTMDEVVFQGGEPTLNPALFRYARYARERGARQVTLVTNGLRLAYAPFARGCLDAGIDRFFFALASHEAETNDMLCQRPGALELKLKALDNLLALGAGPRVRLVHLVNRHNFAALEGFARFVHQRLSGVGSLEIKLMQCLGRVEDNRELIPSLTELGPPLQRALDLCDELGLEVVTNGVPACVNPRHQRRTVAYHLRRSGGSITGRRFLPLCEGCPLEPGCLGVRADYLEIFGEHEIAAARAALHDNGGQTRAHAAAEALRGRHVPARGHALGLRKLLGVSGCEASAEELDTPPPAWLCDTLTMRGFKPAELAMLRHDLRPVVKLEDIPAPAARRFTRRHGDAYRLVLSEHYVKDDLAVDQLPADRSQDREAGPPEAEDTLVTIYASRGDEAARLRDLDRAGQRDTAAEAGALLGYPSCCVEHFARVSERGHEAGQGINEALVRSARGRTPAPGGPLPWQTNVFTDRSLLSFYPCSLRCAEAVAWADRAMAALREDDADLADACRDACARPVLFFRLPFLVVFDGRVEGDSLFYDSFAINTYGDHATRRLQGLFAADLGRLLAAGDRLTVTDRELSIALADKLVARLVKQSPDACLLLGFA